ncbi:MAG: hypothetical protein JXR76_27710 [Deltaproteobacteria bacterium]|nr:hypothetical protein [Deltaproteobacteria bacterium]
MSVSLTEFALRPVGDETAEIRSVSDTLVAIKYALDGQSTSLVMLASNFGGWSTATSGEILSPAEFNTNLILFDSASRGTDQRDTWLWGAANNRFASWMGTNAGAGIPVNSHPSWLFDGELVRFDASFNLAELHVIQNLRGIKMDSLGTKYLLVTGGLPFTRVDDWVSMGDDTLVVRMEKDQTIRWRSALGTTKVNVSPWNTPTIPSLISASVAGEENVEQTSKNILLGITSKYVVGTSISSYETAFFGNDVKGVQHTPEGHTRHTQQPLPA